MTTKRLERIASLIQQKLARIIQQKIRDPRVQWVTISDVEVSRDLAYAKVYFTVLSGAHQSAEQVLNKASHYLRTALGRTLETRVSPELHFIYDDTIEHGRRMSHLLKDIDLPNDEHDD